MSERGFGALDVLVADPSSTAVLTDYDGTLAPIVTNPDLSLPLPGSVEVLRRLARRFAVVGVVSGRPASFLAAKLAEAGPAVHLVGVYGFEWVEDGEVRIAPEVRPWLEASTRVLEAARSEAPDGVGIEDKGASVTLHWRAAPEAGDWASRFSRTWAEVTGLVLQPGRMAVEFRPPVGIDKGTVVERLAQGCSAACFAGDDAGDVPAFEALDRLAANGMKTVRVAIADEESPPELSALADLVLAGPADALAVLRHLADAVVEPR